jgi:2-iminobutanoate/2-iminopropanoate deaminase
MHSIETKDAPTAAGHYAQAIVHNGLAYVAGQLPIDPKNREKPIGSIEEQTELTLRNVEAILVAAGSGLDQILQMTVYVTDISLWSGVNAAYARVMGSHKPARAIVPVKDLHYGYQIEIQAIAAVRA